jgi:hypothetical protein
MRYYSLMFKTSKHEKNILSIVTDEYKSTTHIQDELQKKTGKKVNWYMVAGVLTLLEHKNKVERHELRKTILWRKKQ